MPKQKQNNHIPVLLQEVVDGLKPKVGNSYLDLTAGYGGHAKACGISPTKGTRRRKSGLPLAFLSLLMGVTSVGLSNATGVNTSKFTAEE